MRYWLYCEPAGDSSVPVYQILSDKAILATYWDYWCDRMKQAGREHQISENNCVTDWVAVHWAEPATLETLQRIIQAPKGQ